MAARHIGHRYLLTEERGSLATRGQTTPKGGKWGGGGEGGGTIRVPFSFCCCRAAGPY